MASTFQTLGNVFTDVRYIAGKDSSTLPDAQLLPLANKYYGLIMRELVDGNEDLYSEISSTALVAGQKEYPLPADSASTYGGGLIKIMRVEVSYDAINWYVASPFDLDQVNFALNNPDATVNGNFSKTSPKFSYWDRGIWLYPIPQSTDSVAVENTNLKIFWVKRPNEMTATTDIPEMPKDFLAILSEGMLIDVYRRFNRVGESDRSRINYNAMLQRAKQLEVQTDEPLVMTPSDRISDYY